MALSGKQFGQLHDALMKAFPDFASLRLFVRVELEENLTTISGENNLSEAVYKLVDWAIAKGRVEELVEKAHNRNRGNPELKAFAASYLKVVSEPENSRSQPPPPTDKFALYYQRMDSPDMKRITLFWQERISNILSYNGPGNLDTKRGENKLD